MRVNKAVNKMKTNGEQANIASNTNIVVLLIEEPQVRTSPLKKALLDFNYQITKQLSFNDNIITEVEYCNPDILILSTDLASDKMLKDLAEINKLLPLPIVIFAEYDSPNVIKKAIKAGVSAYVVHEILPQRIKSILLVANERFKAVQALRNELKQAKSQLEDRKYIERAKGYIMQQKQISESEAYAALRKMAMDQSSTLATVSKNIIDVCQLFSKSSV
jgi:response regulator NasT|tara:strand:+ start:836 stop:1492 length:657 start_codon:yes stop_codon:yes gene_type:complete